MAGYSPDTSNASKLTANNRIQQRIAEIQQRAQEQTQTTVSSLIAAADEVRELAIQHRQLSAAVGAIREMGVLSGLRIDRREVGAPGDFDRMSDVELLSFIALETAMLIELPDDEPNEARRGSAASLPRQ
jgi:hypothetical protein